MAPESHITELFSVLKQHPSLMFYIEGNENQCNLSFGTGWSKKNVIESFMELLQATLETKIKYEITYAEPCILMGTEDECTVEVKTTDRINLADTIINALTRYFNYYVSPALDRERRQAWRKDALLGEGFTFNPIYTFYLKKTMLVPAQLPCLIYAQDPLYIDEGALFCIAPKENGHNKKISQGDTNQILATLERLQSELEQPVMAIMSPKGGKLITCQKNRRTFSEVLVNEWHYVVAAYHKNSIYLH